ncbi:MAG: radical SAM protein [Pseudomonadota bacterium]|nr:radical SAM protein [Pseudomonadota bacterium]
MITFGPVPSRRLGRSLGINNIPPKSCSYSCLYCQVGPTQQKEIALRPFYTPEAIKQAVVQQVESVSSAGEQIDYLTFVPDGEPTLDSNLGETIELLRPLGYKIAVISNASLVWKTEVQNALHKADWVSLKVDASDGPTWRLINRPHRDLQLDRILDGIKSFANDYQGTLATETMLVQGINDSVASVTTVADYLEQLVPAAAYLAVPTRPTSETDIVPPAERVINQAYQILSNKLPRVELLIGYEGNAFAFSGNTEEDLLSITAVHPMREEAVKAYLLKAGEDWELVLRLIEEGKLQKTEHQGSRFYLRCLPNR